LPASPYPTSDWYRPTRADPGAPRSSAAEIFLFTGAAVHLLSIPIGLFLFKLLVESEAGRSLSWRELFSALAETGYAVLIIIGIVGQFAFVWIAILGGVLIRSGRVGAATPMIVVGIFAVNFSYIVFGGVVGAIGGFLMIAGGVQSLLRPGATRAAPPYTPPPYLPPPYTP